MRTQVAGADGDDPLAALQVAARLQREVDRIQEVSVRRARVRGLSWLQIADVLGVSRRAVRRRYGGLRSSR